MSLSKCFLFILLIISDDITTNVDAKVVISDCPRGERVINGSVLTGTSATCQCHSDTLSDVQWFSSDDQPMGPRQVMAVLHFGFNDSLIANKPCILSPRSRYINGRCYHIFNQSLTWSEAKSFCTDLKGPGTLAAIFTEEEMYIIAAEANAPVWIGANDLEEEGVWRWTDGSPANISHLWQTFEPSNGVRNDSCVYIDSNAQLNVAMCQSSYNFICVDTQCDYLTEDNLSGRCFGFESTMTNWYDAKTECTTVVYQHLATIQNDDERLYLKSKLQSLQANYWIGAFTENREWKWIDGGSTSFDGMWADKDAANLLQSENCVQISTSGYLSDRNCQSSFGYICMSSAINQWYECREYLDNSTTVESAEYFVPQFADIPVTVHFTINNNSSIELLKGEKVKFFCEVSAIPEAVAVITGSNLSRILDQRSNSSRLELVLDDVQCTDSGRYFCWGSNGLETNLHEIWKYVDILMECAPAVVDSSLTIQIPESGNTTITLEILGYPEPTAYGLQIQLGQSMSNTDDYNVVYTKLTPPFGLVTLTIYDENKQISLTYIFTILNAAGNSTITFDVVKKEYNGIPVTISFTVNDMVSIELTKGEKIKFFCEVEAIPEAVAVITGSNLSRIQDQRSNSSRLELVLDEVQCTDSGRYFCWGSNGFETNSHEIWKFVDILMECAPAVVNRSLTIQIPESGNTTITLEILGYPEPTAYGLQIQSGQSMSNTDDYNVVYTKLTPPLGLVTLTIYDENTQISLTYIFTIMNSAGNITFTFDVVKQDMSEKVHDDVTQLHVMVYVGVTCGLLIVLVMSVFVGRIVVNRWSSRRANHHDYGISGSSLHMANFKNNLSSPDKTKTETTSEPPLHTVDTNDSCHRKVQM